MFQVNSEEDLIEKISYIFAQFQDFQNFINVKKITFMFIIIILHLFSIYN